MPFGVLGLNHDTAPMKIRESISFSANEIAPALKGLCALKGVVEGVLLSTCNRSEFYYRTEKKKQVKEILNWFAKTREIEPEVLQDHIYKQNGLETARHLFEVITGLDSMVLGEVEIAGQVKEAYKQSKAIGTDGKYLNHLFQKSFAVNKEVRRELELDGMPVSLSHVGVDKVEMVMDGLSCAKAIIIGAGEVGKLALKYLFDHGIDKVWVANRTWERSKKVTGDIGGTPVTFGEKEEFIPKTDIIITATGCPYTLIDKEVIPSERDKPLYIVDLAVPRDVDPNIRHVDGCHVYDIDGLQEAAEQNLAERKEQAESVSPIVQKHVNDFAGWLKIQDISGIIASLKSKVEEIRKEEVDKLNKDRVTKEELDIISNQILNKIFHRPIVELKNTAKEEDCNNLAESLVKLFDL